MKKPTTKKRSRTNSARINKLKDSEIDLSDLQEEGKYFFNRTVLRRPDDENIVVGIRLDLRVVKWFKAKVDIRRGSMRS